jgi:hypothetical protein
VWYSFRSICRVDRTEICWLVRGLSSRLEVGVMEGDIEVELVEAEAVLVEEADRANDNGASQCSSIRS